MVPLVHVPEQYSGVGTGKRRTCDGVMVKTCCLTCAVNYKSVVTSTAVVSKGGRGITIYVAIAI